MDMENADSDSGDSVVFEPSGPSKPKLPPVVEVSRGPLQDVLKIYVRCTTGKLYLLPTCLELQVFICNGQK